MYRDSIERKLIIKTSNNEFIVNLTIDEIMNKLDSRFKQCHRGCIYNNDRVTEKNYIDGYFITDTGEQVNMLSKKYRED